MEKDQGSKQRLLSSIMQKLITRHNIMYEQSIRVLTALSLT
jgi:hypothetical protein